MTARILYNNAISLFRRCLAVMNKYNQVTNIGDDRVLEMYRRTVEAAKATKEAMRHNGCSCGRVCPYCNPARPVPFPDPYPPLHPVNPGRSPKRLIIEF